MLKKFFTDFFLIQLLNFIFLINAMELALTTPEILRKIFKQTIIDYRNQIVQNQHDIQETFQNYHCKNFETCDVSLFVPKFPSCVSVNKTWKAVFKKTFLKIQSLLPIKETNPTILNFYLYRPQPCIEKLKNILYLHPLSTITKDQLEENIKMNIPTEMEAVTRLEQLEDRLQLYQKAFFNNQQSTRFNLLLLTAFELLPYNNISELKEYRRFFYQLFFNSSLDSTSKYAFLNYLLEGSLSLYGAEDLIKIAFDSHRFKIDYKKLPFTTIVSRKEILSQLGFLVEKIEEINHKNPFNN